MKKFGICLLFVFMWTVFLKQPVENKQCIEMYGEFKIRTWPASNSQTQFFVEGKDKDNRLWIIPWSNIRAVVKD